MQCDGECVSNGMSERQRRVECHNVDGEILDDEECDVSNRPLDTELCVITHTDRCKAAWSPQPWSKVADLTGGAI